MTAQALSSRAIIGTFYEALEQGAAPWVENLSMYFESDQSSETYNWLGMTPAMREWIGGRNPKGFRTNGITIENKEFEATLEVLVKDLRRDKTGQLMIRIQELADRANSHWASLLSTLLINAEATVCYDNQYFFDTDHSEGNSGTQNNDITVDISALPVADHGSVTAPSVAEMALSIEQGITQIYSFKDDQGEVMNETAQNFLVIVPTSLRTTARSAISNKVLAGGADNALATQDDYTVKLAANPRLTWTDKFAVFRTDGRTKPFIRQEEQGVQISAQAEGSDIEFYEKMHHYGIDASRNVGYGMWQHACLVTMI